MGVTGNELGRIAAYIDGFNLYHGMLEADWGRYRWLDHASLVASLVEDGGEIQAVNYFTSLVVEPDRLKRQKNYLKALREHSGVNVSYGRMERRPQKCALCDGWYRRQQEKETDVRLATAMVADAFDDTYDTALLISADSDLVPAVMLVQERFDKRMILIDPPRRHSDELLRLASNKRQRLREDHLAQCQLPDPVERIWNGHVKRRWHRPDSWA